MVTTCTVYSNNGDQMFTFSRSLGGRMVKSRLTVGPSLKTRPHEAPDIVFGSLPLDRCSWNRTTTTNDTDKPARPRTVPARLPRAASTPSGIPRALCARGLPRPGKQIVPLQRRLRRRRRGGRQLSHAGARAAGHEADGVHLCAVDGGASHAASCAEGSAALAASAGQAAAAVYAAA